MSDTRTTGSFAAELEDLTTNGGYRVAQISPADNPSAAVLCKGERTLTLRAKGSHTVLRPSHDKPVMPSHSPTLEITRQTDSPDWGDGRAGMGYRDMVPSRQGGRIIASHIQIASGGPVSDYVHFHNICFQMIYVHRGWVRLVYEDQGEPFVMEAGDCVLQPPHIRHQVLESSPGLEVIEVGAPASHDTFGDLEMTLPTSTLSPERDFGGQIYWLHKASKASWAPSKYSGFRSSDLGLAQATNGVADVHVHAAADSATGSEVMLAGESQLLCVLSGELLLQAEGQSFQLTEGDCVVIPRWRCPSSRLCWTVADVDGQLLGSTVSRFRPLLAATVLGLIVAGCGSSNLATLELPATTPLTTAPPTTATTAAPTTRPPQPPPWTGLERIVETREYPVFATTGGLELLHPARAVERIGFHESSHDGAQQMEVLDSTAAWIVMDTRNRGNGSRTAADIVVDPTNPIVAPISGTVVRAGQYTLYCEHADNFLVIEPDGQPGWEVKMFHIRDLTVGSGDVVIGGETQVAVGARLLPFDSQVDAYTAEPAWGHVHVEVVDPSIPDRKRQEVAVKPPPISAFKYVSDRSRNRTRFLVRSVPDW